MSTDLTDERNHSERRNAPRCTINCTVVVHGNEDWASHYNTSNISLTGAFISTDSFPPRGQIITLDLILDEETKIEKIKALIVHVREKALDPTAQGFGVMFLNTSKEQKNTLTTFLSKADSQ